MVATPGDQVAVSTFQLLLIFQSLVRVRSVDALRIGPLPVEPLNVSVPAGVRSRGQCSGGSTTQPYTYCLPSQVSYGIAVTGVADPQQELYRVTLSVGR